MKVCMRISDIVPLRVKELLPKPKTSPTFPFTSIYEIYFIRHKNMILTNANKILSLCSFCKIKIIYITFKFNYPLEKHGRAYSSNPLNCSVFVCTLEICFSSSLSDQAESSSLTALLNFKLLD